MPRRIDTQAVIDSVRLEEQASDPSTPASGYGNLYVKTDGRIYFISDSGAVYDLTEGAGPASSTDNAVVRWDGTGGNTLQNSAVLIDDTGNLDMQGKEIRNFAEQAITTSKGTETYDIDWSAASLFEITMTGNPTFTFSNLASGRSITVTLIQDGTGGRTVTWPGSVNWPNGEPTLHTGASAIDVITLFVRADGSTVEGFGITQDYPTEGAWTDYSGTSTITGWSSYTQKQLHYKTIGNNVFVVFQLTGTSNSTNTSFTLPFSRTGAPTNLNIPILAKNNGSQISTALGFLVASTNTVNFYIDMDGNGWTGSGTKDIRGFFVYEK